MSKIKDIDEILTIHDGRVRKYKDMLPDTNDITLITLKGHLIIEEILYEILKSHCTSPKYLEKSKLTFAQLAYLTQALINLPIQELVFPPIMKLNSLRNTLAHNLDSDKADKLVNETINLCLDKENRKILSDKSLSEKLKFSLGYILGQLSVTGAVSEILEKQLIAEK